MLCFLSSITVLTDKNTKLCKLTDIVGEVIVSQALKTAEAASLDAEAASLNAASIAFFNALDLSIADRLDKIRKSLKL